METIQGSFHFVWTKVYVDLDGTIAGEYEWKGFFHNTSSLFTKLLWKPDPVTMYSILTSRPAVDLPIIKLVCLKWGLKPDDIITSPSILYKYKDKEEIAQWKFSVLLKAITQNPFIQRVIYLDNDTELLEIMPSHRGIIYSTAETWAEVLRHGGPEELPTRPFIFT